MDCSYVNRIIEKYSNNQLTQNEKNACSKLSQLLHNWFNSYYIINSLYSPKLEIKQSGSKAKKTAIKGKSDIDLFLSITDSGNAETLENYYNSAFKYLKNYGLNVRKQNVSIGLKYNGLDIDIVPAKKVNTTSYERYYDHYLWSNKRNERTLTNIQKHIDMVNNSGLQKEIMLIKIWRENHNLDFPSIYIEQLCINELSRNNLYNLADNFIHMLNYIKDNIENKSIVDPSNCNNIISDLLTKQEKKDIASQARESLSKEYWKDILW